VQQLDNNLYNDEDLIEVKIPLNLPYMTSWSEYERVDGEIELQGIYYNYVKRKVSNDTLYLKCLPNTDKTKLHAGRNDYAKQANDLPSGEKDKTIPGKKNNIFSEYNPPHTQYVLQVPVRYTTLRHHCLVAHLIDPLINNAWHPPQVNS
jgi:hypothetical protein